jgi:hypothetical protein
MSYNRIPGVPRGRMRSRPDADAYSPDAFEILEEHRERLTGLESAVAKIDLGQATILSEVREIKASDRQATAKLIGAAISTIVLTVGGILGGTAALRPSATPPVVVQRSELDKKLDTCRAMAPGPSRDECRVRVAAEPEP